MKKANCINCGLTCNGKQCNACYSDPRAAARKLLERVNAIAKADMLAGNPITSAHHRAILKVLETLK